jgi:hypothetical protein
MRRAPQRSQERCHGSVHAVARELEETVRRRVAALGFSLRASVMTARRCSVRWGLPRWLSISAASLPMAACLLAYGLLHPAALGG